MKSKNPLLVLAILDALVLAILTVIWLTAKSSSGDQSIALGAVFLVSFIFVCSPLFFIVAGLVIEKISRAGLAKAKLSLIYVLLSLIGHLALAYDAGFFDQWIESVQRARIEQANPAQTKLRYAMNLGPIPNIDKINAALAEGADPNGWSTPMGKIPLLIMAAQWSDPASIKALLAAGADVNAQAKISFNHIDTPTALDLVAFSENSGALKSIDILLAAGAHVETSMLLIGSCWRGDTALYERTFKLGGKHLTDNQGNSCLHHAAKANQVDFLSEILSAQLSAESLASLLNAVNQRQETPLDSAAMNGNIDAALIILQAGGVSKSPNIRRQLERFPSSSALEKLRLALSLESL